MSNSAKKALTHSSIYAAGNITRQLAGFIMLPIYTRQLTPTDYGVIGLLLALMALMEVFFGARLALSVPKFYFDEQDHAKRNSVVATALIITSGASLITMLALLAAKDLSSTLLFNTSAYGGVVGLFATLILTQAVEHYGMTFIRIQQRPWLFVGVSIAKLIVQLSLNIWLVVFAKMGVLGVAISSASVSLLFAFGLAIYTLGKTGISFSTYYATKMIRYSWPLWLAGLAGLYMGSANRYFINLFSSTADVGLFELAVKFSAILGLIIWDPFQQYWHTESFKIYHKPNAIQAYQTAFHGMSALLAIGALGISLFSDPVIRIMAAPAFHDAAKAVPFLAISLMLNCLTAFPNFSFYVKEQTLWITRNNYITAAILTVFFFAFVPSLGFVGAAAAGLAAWAIQFLLVYLASRKIYDMEFKLGPLLCHLTIISAGVILAQTLKNQSLLWLIAGSTLIFIIGSMLIIAIALTHKPFRVYALQLPYIKQMTQK